MRIVKLIKQMVQFIFDPEMYCLAWIAIKNEFRKPRVSELPISDSEEKRAQAAQGR